MSFFHHSGSNFAAMKAHARQSCCRIISDKLETLDSKIDEIGGRSAKARGTDYGHKANDQ